MAKSKLRALKTPPPLFSQPLLWLLAVVFTLLTVFRPSGPAYAQAPDGADQECLACHGNPDLKMALPSGEEISLFVSGDQLAHSVHATIGITCQNCHTDIHDYPHPPLEAQNRREFSQHFFQTCQRCHTANYEHARDSIHAEAAGAGDPNAPLCTDCHGAHEIQPPAEPRSRIATTCAQCHQPVFDQYKESVHGAASLGDNNPDVPVCTDCHGVHNIHAASTVQFRVETPELCARCHADPELMAKYGISSEVYDIYRLSWHGVDVSAYKTRWPNVWHNSAVCTDCHGTHDIRTTSDPASHVNPTNLLGTCQKCHPSAGPNWVGAWTGHNRVSAERTPFVYYTQVFYETFSYAALWMSAIYVLLQIIRATAARIRRSL